MSDLNEPRETAEKMIAMASGEEEIEDDEGGGKRLFIMIGLPLPLIIGGGAGAFFSGLADPLLNMLGGDEPVVEEVAEPAEPAAPSRAPVGTAIFYDLPEMLVNLNTAGQRRNFLKILISLELASEGDITTVEAVLPRIVDNFQVYLRELRMEDLQGVGGMARLRKELLDRVNSAVSPTQINDVLFKEMIVQ